MKARRSNIRMCTHGGILPVLKCIKDFGIPALIRSYLGARPAQAKYGHEECIIAWMLTNLSGGFRLDHITKAKKDFAVIEEREFKLPSHDTAGRCFKKLATHIERSEHDIVRDGSVKRIHQEINENLTLNRLLIRSGKRLRAIKTRVPNTIDMDVTLVHTECRDTRHTYQMQKGYAPMVSFIGLTPVYIGMRNGNVSPASLAKESLEKTFALLKEQDIYVDKVRMDGATYSFETYDYIHESGKKFYIAMKTSAAVIEATHMCNFSEEDDFKMSTNCWTNLESGEASYQFSKGKKEYRLVAFQVKMNDEGSGPRGWADGKDGYAYKIILTNDNKTSVREIIRFYNQRGAIEHNFNHLKNDFAWRLPPFSNMNENLVFFFVGALTSVVYQAVLRRLKKKVPIIRLNMRLLEFIFIFMSVGLSREGDCYIFHEAKDGIPYEKLM